MKRGVIRIVTLCGLAAVAFGFAQAFCWWFGLAADARRDVFLLYAAAMLVMAGLCIAGDLIGFRGYVWYMIAGGAAFLAIDVIIMLRFDITAGAKTYQDGFIPASIMGLFLGVLYRIVTMPTPVLPRDPPA